MADNVKNQGPQTTGHVWDDTLEEYNNPLPVWWTYAFYATIVFAIVYWLYYPSWPIGQRFMTGLGTVEYRNAEGKTESWHWNTRAKLLKETQDAVALQKPYYDKILSLPFEQISKDPQLYSFVQSAGKPLFADNCAPCHQSGGGGKIGYYPNLTDDDWIYGGGYDKIQETITHGRHGYMPPFAEALAPEQIDYLANYVLSLSGNKVDPAKAAKGDELFHADTAACFYCHGTDAKGRQDIGSANLTDKIWRFVDVSGTPDTAGKIAAVSQIINGGLNRSVMPLWEGRLTPEQIKLLAVYVHELGGGK